MGFRDALEREVRGEEGNHNRGMRNKREDGGRKKVMKERKGREREDDRRGAEGKERTKEGGQKRTKKDRGKKEGKEKKGRGKKRTK